MNLYLRLLKLLLILPFVRKKSLLETGRIAFRAWPTDCDLNFHLNNGRYLTFMDLGRVHLIAQIGLMSTLLRNRWAPVLSAVEMHYIRPIKPFAKFVIESRLLTWDEKYFYIEQRFVSASRLHAVGMVKGLFLRGRERVESRRVLDMLGLDLTPPAAPQAARLWNVRGKVTNDQILGTLQS